MAKRSKVTDGTEVPEGRFPSVDLPITPPYPPMEAKRVDKIPEGQGWQYEPKWDGFRALVFRDGATLTIQSKAGQPLDRYFPELADAFLRLDADSFVLDGEIVVPIEGRLSFDDLLQRIHPAASRIKKLSEQTPARFFAFDLLAGPARAGAVSHVEKSLSERRKLLEDFVARYEGAPTIQLSPATEDRGVADECFICGPIYKRADGCRTLAIRTCRLSTLDRLDQHSFMDREASHDFCRRLVYRGRQRRASVRQHSLSCGQW